MPATGPSRRSDPLTSGLIRTAVLGRTAILAVIAAPSEAAGPWADQTNADQNTEDQDSAAHIRRNTANADPVNAVPDKEAQAAHRSGVDNGPRLARGCRLTTAEPAVPNPTMRAMMVAAAIKTVIAADL